VRDKVKTGMKNRVNLFALSSRYCSILAAVTARRKPAGQFAHHGLEAEE
jgi:hypothetical protein